jgi:hypothetical protein
MASKIDRLVEEYAVHVAHKKGQMVVEVARCFTRSRTVIRSHAEERDGPAPPYQRALSDANTGAV